MSSIYCCFFPIVGCQLRYQPTGSVIYIWATSDVGGFIGILDIARGTAFTFQVTDTTSQITANGDVFSFRLVGRFFGLAARVFCPPCPSRWW